MGRNSTPKQASKAEKKKTRTKLSHKSTRRRGEKWKAIKRIFQLLNEIVFNFLLLDICVKIAQLLSSCSLDSTHIRLTCDGMSAFPLSLLNEEEKNEREGKCEPSKWIIQHPLSARVKKSEKPRQSDLQAK